MRKILILEDDLEIANLLNILLTNEGHDVQIFHTGKDFMNYASQNESDLIILDILLPDVSGLEVCKQLKKEQVFQSIPVIALTSRSDKFDIIKGLSVGFDDYVTKPFDNNILTAKINAILRKESFTKGSGSKIININNDLILDKEAFSLKIEDKNINLTFLEFKTLCFLLENKNKVVNRNLIIEIIKDDNIDSSDRSVDKIINRIRKKIGKYAGNIVAVYGAGYCFKDIPKETLSC